MTIYRRHPLPTTFLSRPVMTHISNNFFNPVPLFIRFGQLPRQEIKTTTEKPLN